MVGMENGCRYNKEELIENLSRKLDLKLLESHRRTADLMLLFHKLIIRRIDDRQDDNPKIL